MKIDRAYVVAARRSAIGRIGGLHRRRRVEDLAAPVVAAVLEDCGLAASTVEQVILGNTSAGNNPARLVALAAGLPDRVSALTLDRACASGLDAILAAARLVATEEASVIVAGAAEAYSTAPWRIVKPRTIYQLPFFDGVGAGEGADPMNPTLVEAAAALARDRNYSRDDLDAYALRSHLKAHLAQQAKQFVGEIVPLKRIAEEGRDESPDSDLEADDLADFAAFDDGDGVISPGNVSHRHDGAAMTVVVSESMWASLGKPRALRLSAAAVKAVAPAREALAPVEAMRQLLERADTPVTGHLIEMSESSAAQALALLEAFRISDDMLNCAGGAIARGHPGGASSAVLVARLFSSLVRQPKSDAPKHGIAVQGADGGLSVAAAFDVV